MKPRALIAEDEPLLAETLRSALAAAWPELEVVAVAPNGPNALALAEEHRPDVVFLDIRMPGLSGLEVAAELVDRAGGDEQVPALVFVTAYDDHALEAFDYAAVDYVLKPARPERLAHTVARLKARLAAPGAGLAELVEKLRHVMKAGAPQSGAEPLRHIRAGTGNNVRLIPVEQVCYFQAADKYTNVVTAEGEALIRTSLRDLLAQLPAARFKQIHRSTVVNLDEVAAAMRDDAGRLSLRLRRRAEKLPVSRVFADLFKQM